MILLWYLVLCLNPQTPGATASFEQLSARATQAREANDGDRAISLYNQAVVRRPKWAEGWYFLATLEYDRDHYEAARDAFRRFLVLDPGKGAGWALLGLCEFQTKEFGPAVDHLSRGIHLGLGGGDQLEKVARYHDAILLTHFGRFEEAAQQMAWFARSGLDDEPRIVLLTGLASLRKPLFPEETAESDRNVAMAAGRAVLDMMARRAARAAEEMKALAASYPDTPNVHYIFGSYLLEVDPDSGLRELKRELEISPEHVPALTTIAIQLLKDDAAGAIPYARKAAKLSPDSFATRNVYGRVLVESGDLKGGIAELEASEKLAPQAVQTRIALASAYAKAGRKEDAARERAEFLRLKASTGEAPVK